MKGTHFKLLIFVLIFISLLIPSLHSLVLNVPLKTQVQTNWSWAGVSESIIEYYKIYVSQETIAAFGTGGEDIPNRLYGESPIQKGINLILDNWGISSIYGNYVMTYNSIRGRLNKGQPFIILWAWTNGGEHFVVGHGYKGGDVYIMDPGMGEGYSVELYDWVVSGGIHTWTHSLECTKNILDPPTWISAVSIAPDKIELTWTDNLTNEINYFLYRNLENDPETSELIATLSSNQTNYMDSDLENEEMYYYWTKVVKSVFPPSEYSESIEAFIYTFTETVGVYPTKFDLNIDDTVKIKYDGDIPDSMGEFPEVDIKIYDTFGNIVRSWNKQATYRKRIVKWNGKNQNGIILNAGVYIVHVKSTKFNKKIKMMIVK